MALPLSLPPRAPAASPAAGGAPQVSPAAAPTMAKGNEAKAVTLVRQAIQLLHQAIPLVEPGSQLAETLLSAAKSLGKHAPPAAADPGVQMTNLRDLMQKAQSQSPMAALRGLAGGTAPAPTGVPNG